MCCKSALRQWAGNKACRLSCWLRLAARYFAGRWTVPGMRLPIPANSKQAGFRSTLPGRMLGGNFRVADRTSRENPIARLRALSWFIPFRFRRCDYLDSTRSH
jgi:hypothetical protein